jgi:hypothetical protein
MTRSATSNFAAIGQPSPALAACARTHLPKGCQLWLSSLPSAVRHLRVPTKLRRARSPYQPQRGRSACASLSRGIEFP